MYYTLIRNVPFSFPVRQLLPFQKICSGTHPTTIGMGTTVVIIELKKIKKKKGKKKVEGGVGGNNNASETILWANLKWGVIRCK